MSTLQDTDLILVNRGGTDYKITFADWKNSQSKAPDVGTVVLADSPEAGRFTSATFASTVTMTEDGIPASTKGLKAWVEGSLLITPESDEITAVNTSGAQPVLTFKTDKDLANFAPGDAIQQENSGPPAGTPAAIAKALIGKFVNDPPNNYFSDPKVIADGNINTQLYITPLGTGGLWGGGSAADNKAVITLMNIPPGALVEAYTVIGSAPPMYYKINGGSDNVVPIANYKNGWTEIATGQVTEISWSNFSSSDFIMMSAIRVNGVIIGTPITINPAGTVGSVDVAAKTMTLATSTGTWGPANAGHYVIGPTKTPSNVKLYTVHDAAGNVSDLQSADPGYVTMTGNSPYTLTFPATLPSGNPPDSDLPAGTTLTTEVQATNTAGTDSATSNTVTPA